MPWENSHWLLWNTAVRKERVRPCTGWGGGEEKNTKAEVGTRPSAREEGGNLESSQNVLRSLVPALHSGGA